jgi:putative endopeptidase
MLTLTGNDDKTAEHKADVIIDFEHELAKHSMPDEDYSEDTIYNYYSLSQLQKYFGSYDLKAIANVHGFNIRDKVVVQDTGAMKFYASYFDGKHTEELKCIAEISFISFYSSLLTEDFMQANNLLCEAIYGYNPQNTIYTDAFNATTNLMDDYLGKLYCERRFSDEDKERIKSMTDSIIAAYKKRIAALDWMSDTTKAEAVKKLDNLNVIIGMPETGESFLPNITIYGKGSRDDAYLSNIYGLLRYSDNVLADMLNGEMQLGDISFSAYTVNAMYYPDFNAIVLPAGILNKPIYDSSASLAENYGAIGYVISHEISHAFDTTGAKYDENGNYKNWWTDEDYANFEKLSKAVEEYYDGAEAVTGLTVNGKLTLNENIADIGGIAAALDAYTSVEENPDYKKFFEQFAYTMRSSESREVMKSSLYEDTHSPRRIRVNYAVKTTDEFYTAFGVTEGDGMYVPKEERIRIW